MAAGIGTTHEAQATRTHHTARPDRERSCKKRCMQEIGTKAEQTMMHTHQKNDPKPCIVMKPSNQCSKLQVVYSASMCTLSLSCRHLCWALRADEEQQTSNTARYQTAKQSGQGR